MKDALELTQQLITRGSVTPDDAGCQALITQRLANVDFRCKPIFLGGVSNLWARHGSAHPVVCFAGHTDVVPPGPNAQWHSPPFAPTVRDGKLFGRGSADMKSSVAAFVVAAEAYVSEHPDHVGSVALLLTSDEEGPAVNGTTRVVDQLKQCGERLDYCIVGEPTSVETLGDTIKNGRRGSLSGRLTVRGVQGHVAYPQLAKNPIHLVAPALAELAATEWDQGDEHFPATTWQASNIHAGTNSANVIPGTLELDFNFRFSPTSSAQSLQARLESILHRHTLDFSVTWNLSAMPFLTRPGELIEIVTRVVRRHTGRTPQLSTSGGTSDARFIAEICPQIVELGPVNASIHKADEHIDLEALEKLPRIYLDVLRELLG